jgi:hypothetical protein
LTFTEIVDHIADRMNLKSDLQLARVGTEVNLRHREILSSLGVSQVTERTVATATTTINNRFLTFGPSPVAVVKILAVYNLVPGTYPPPILDEVTPDAMLSLGLQADPPTKYAITGMGERTVTIQLNSVPATAYVLTALHQDMNGVQYKQWRFAVFVRDGFACVQCGAKRPIQADHIKPYALFEDLRYDVSNGQTLCVPCHTKTPAYGRRTAVAA